MVLSTGTPRSSGGASLDYCAMRLYTCFSEQADGLIVDWQLYQEQAADSRMIPKHMRRMKEENGIALKGMAGDRGFDSAENIRLLGDEIANNLCPRNIERLAQRLQNKAFRQHQTRRSSATFSSAV